MRERERTETGHISRARISLAENALESKNITGSGFEPLRAAVVRCRFDDRARGGDKSEECRNAGRIGGSTVGAGSDGSDDDGSSFPRANSPATHTQIHIQIHTDVNTYTHTHTQINT